MPAVAQRDPSAAINHFRLQVADATAKAGGLQHTDGKKNDSHLQWHVWSIAAEFINAANAARPSKMVSACP